MFTEMTFEFIFQRMIDNVLDKNPNIDVREGSIIYNALAPAAVELANMYIELDFILNETFADTASRENLIKRIAERGITPRQATHAIRKGEFNIDIPIGSRFSLNQLNYVTVEKIADGIFKLQCETSGVIGNNETGNLIPIDYIEGLTSALLTDVLIPGEDEEDTETLRDRYFNSLESQAFGGNIADYKEKVNAIDGVGGLKVIPTWNGGGTVKLILINSAYSKPSTTLIDYVQEIVDPTQNQGQGVGIAPIGHVVTVVGCAETIINIETHITYESGWSWSDIEDYVIEEINKYFKELATNWATNDNLIVRISQIETRLLNLPGILDISNTTINNISGNLVIDFDNIPVLGDVSNV